MISTAWFCFRGAVLIQIATLSGHGFLRGVGGLKKGSSGPLRSGQVGHIYLSFLTYQKIVITLLFFFPHATLQIGSHAMNLIYFILHAANLE